MKNLTLTLEEELCMLDKYGLTPNELFVIRSIILLQDEGLEDNFRKMLKVLKNGNLNLRDILLCLQDKEIILKSFKIPEQGSEFNPYDIPFNKIFLKNLYKASFEMGKELFEVYPQFGIINGSVKFQLRHSIGCENPFNCWKAFISNFFIFKIFSLYLYIK